MALSTDEDDVQIISNPCDEVEIIGEVTNHDFVEHLCDLCCKGQFLIDKLLRYGGLINDKYKYVCDKCDLNFTSKSKLKSHYSKCNGPVSTMEKKKEKRQVTCQDTDPKICSECHTIFKSKGGLTRHMRCKHSGLTHKCEICKAVFSSFKQFSFHCFQHEQNRHYEHVCTVCNKGFSKQKSLLRHETRHTEAHPSTVKT